MIQVLCGCGARREVGEAEAGKSVACSACGKALHLAAAEQLPEGAGVGDFDVCLRVQAGPERLGEQFFLGGVMPLEIGKAEGKPIRLGGKMVSRAHCRLERLDFGPSRWKVVDNRSTNGLFINGQRVSEQELKDGDVVRVGEFELKYVCQSVAAVSAAMEAASAAAAAAPKPAGGGPICPSCEQELPKKAKICVECGIHVPSGRPLLTAKGIDENDLAMRADTWIRLISWIISFGLYPVASEAFGTRKAYAVWTIVSLCVLGSVGYWVAENTDEEGEESVMHLMLWAGKDDPVREEQLLRKMLPPVAPAPAPQALPEPGKPVQPLQMKPGEALELLRELQALSGPKDQFRWYQLITHAFLHGGIMHLAGNMLLLLVLGSRVNELIGNIKAVIVYPLLAVAAAGAHMWSAADGPLHPMLGASGAIMGLAGMYFVLFPAHKVHMVIWLRLPLIGRFRLYYKVFAMRGFWLLVLTVAFNDLLPMVVNISDHVAHWAHLGGFLTGMLLAIGLLIARQVNARGGDLMSVALGRRAWPLLGKPSQWKGELVEA